MSASRFSCIAALAAVVAPAFAAGAVSVSPGFQSSLSTPAPGFFISGMDFLPNGNLAVFDGNSIVEVDRASGAVLATLYTPPGFVFGSFVQTAPNGQFLLFGNSTNDQIVKIPLDGGPPSPITTLHYNFDLVFESDDSALVSAATIPGHNEIVRVDLNSGATDVIADFLGASGPLALDRFGNLYYCEAANTFPPPPGGQDVLRFDAAVVATAAGPGVLTVNDATIVVSGLTTGTDMIIDEEGDLVIAVDGNEASHDMTVREYTTGGTLKSTLAESNAFEYIGPIAFRGNGTTKPSAFGAFQPENGGSLALISTDFFNFTDLQIFTPKRATLETNPPSPIPLGNFTFELDDGPPSGVALLFLATSNLATEIPVFSGGVPFLFGIDPSTIVLSVAIPLDAQGELSIPTTNHGTSGTVHVQAALLTSGGGVGTTTPLALTLQ